ncbi:NADP-dependent oxidoreductase domain-containing protein [Aspergillus cavernicola]|uniref:NADP-dependent oxidoreductase domain-containing protein n=1 Tax=Aspergillus cavernicola TaxID=176166 RepID=A0ABR4J345_9EURO
MTGNKRQASTGVYKYWHYIRARPSQQARETDLLPSVQFLASSLPRFLASLTIQTSPKSIAMSDFLKPAPEPATELGRYRVLSSTAGIRVSPLQLGAMSIGDAWEGMMGSMDKESSFKLLDAFVEAGGNFIDTANNYQDEQSETWLGEWMASRNNRDRMVIATKFTTDYRSHAMGKGNAPNSCGNHRRSLHMSLRDSLRKLQTDWIDVLYVHWWDYTTSIEELMDSLHVMVEQGKVLYLGISDTPAWLASAANTYARAHGKTPFSIYQGRWNVMMRDFERDIIPMALHFGMALAPWDVLGSGKFQSAKAMEERRKAGEGLRTMLGPGQQTPEEVKMSEALAKVAAEHGIESVTAIALAYVLQKVPNVFPLVGGRKIEHLHDNIQALKIKLTPEQMEYLESVRSLDIGFPLSMVGTDPKLTGVPSPWVSFSHKLALPAPLQAIALQ